MNSYRARGFTLVELMVVVVIVTILTLIAMPSFSNWVQSERTRSTAELLQNAFRFAQAEAIRRNRITSLAIPGTTGNSWTITYAVTGQDGTPPSTTLQSIPVTPNVNIGVPSGTSSTVSFDTLGRAYNATSGARATLPGAYIFKVTNSVNLLPDYWVIVYPSGKVTMCDSNLTFDPINQPTGCPATP